MDHDMVEWLNATAERIADALERIANQLEARDKAAEEERDRQERYAEAHAEAEARRRHRMGG